MDDSVLLVVHQASDLNPLFVFDEIAVVCIGLIVSSAEKSISSVASAVTSEFLEHNKISTAVMTAPLVDLL
jgi:hypothetical protein